jgi:hypothetical protein
MTLIAINMQVIGLVVMALWGREYLTANYPLSFSWDYLVIPALLIGIVQSYYLMFRYLNALNRRGDKK